MKKFTLALAAAMVAISSHAAATQLWLMGDPVGGWSPAKGTEMTKTADGVFEGKFTFDKNCHFAFADQLFGDNDWTNFNAHRYGPKQNGITPEPGTPVEMVYGQDCSFQLPAGEYTLTVNTNTMELTVGGEVVRVMGDLYLRGAMNGWGTPDNMKFTKESDDVYSLEVAAIGMGGQFKIANADWSFSFTSDNQAMALGQTYNVQNGSGNNMAFAEAVADVKISIDIKNMTMITQGKRGEIYVPEQLFLTGNVNGSNWNTSAPLAMTKEGNKFTAKNVQLKNLEAGEGDNNAYFTFITTTGESWDDVNAKTRVGAPEHDTPITPELSTGFTVLEPPYANDANSWKIEAGTYDVTIDFETSKVSVTKDFSSAADLSVESAEAPVYYNLQGIRVANPEKGLYIRVQGAKSQVVKF